MEFWYQFWDIIWPPATVRHLAFDVGFFFLVNFWFNNFCKENYIIYLKAQQELAYP